MQTASPADDPNAAISCATPASRHEALFRLAALIRSKMQEEDLFETLTSELHQVVSFDGIGQHDPGAIRQSVNPAEMVRFVVNYDGPAG